MPETPDGDALPCGPVSRFSAGPADARPGRGEHVSPPLVICRVDHPERALHAHRAAVTEGGAAPGPPRPGTAGPATAASPQG